MIIKKKDKYVKKSYSMHKEYNIFDKKYKYCVRDESGGIIFYGFNKQSIFAFVDRLRESGHAVEIDDSVNMSDEQLDELRGEFEEVHVNG